MQAYIGVFVFCMISALVAGFVQKLIDKKKNNRTIHQNIRMLFFYMTLVYGVLSFIKIVLGEAKLSLFDSFTDIVGLTYIHYALPLGVFAILVPVVLTLIFRKRNPDDYMALVDSGTVALLLVTYLITGYISNMVYVCLLCISLVGAAMITFGSKLSLTYCTRENVRRRLRIIVPIVFCLVITMILYLPNEMYLTNFRDMPILYGNMMSALLIGSILFLMVYIAGTVYFLSERQFTLVSGILFALVLMGYIQGTYLNGEMLPMDGMRQEWSVGTVVINAIVWTAIVSGIVFLKFAFQKKADKVYGIICIYISLIQLVTWGYLGITTNKERNYVLTTEKRLELHPENNVLVFVLDWYDEQIIDKILEEDEKFLEPLGDFTHYTNTTSLYLLTGMSLPYMLTDVEWQYDMGDEEYLEYAFENGNLLQDISDRDYDIGVYTDAKYVTEDIMGIVDNYSNKIEQTCDLSDTFDFMLRCSRYKMAPFGIKNEYWYATSDMSKLITQTNVHTADTDIPFYQELTGDGLRIEEYAQSVGAFRFYHLYGAHPPANMSEECTPSNDIHDMIGQGKGCLKIIFEYLEQLKELGIYDNTTIIITADHGQNYLLDRRSIDEYGLQNETSNPILFVKKSGQHNENGMIISDAPVSHSELAATVIEAVGGNSAEYGMTFEEVPENAERERIMIYRRHYDIPYTKYVIRGNVRNVNSWSIEQ